MRLTPSDHSRARISARQGSSPLISLGPAAAGRAPTSRMPSANFRLALRRPASPRQIGGHVRSEQKHREHPPARFPQADEEVNIRLALDLSRPTRNGCRPSISSQDIRPVAFRTRPAAACAASAATGHSTWRTLHASRARRRAFHPEVWGALSFLNWTQLCRRCCWIQSSSIENWFCKEQREETTSYCSKDCRRIASLGNSPASCCPPKGGLLRASLLVSR